jgi:hypothetical protein
VAKLTPREAAARTDFPKAAMNELDEFIASATVDELREFMHWIDQRTSSNAFERAKVALDILLAKEAVTHATKVVSNTKNLAVLTTILIDESKKLGSLTRGLFWLTVALLIFTVLLFAAELRKEPHAVDFVTSSVMVTNVPVYIVITNYSASERTNVLTANASTNAATVAAQK